MTRRHDLLCTAELADRLADAAYMAEYGRQWDMRGGYDPGNRKRREAVDAAAAAAAEQLARAAAAKWGEFHAYDETLPVRRCTESVAG
jgi:hypothetical protein